MTTQELIGTDVEIINALDFEPEFPCESIVEGAKGMPEHPAEWMLKFSCGCAPLVCDNSRQIAVQNSYGLWRTKCICGARDPELLSVVPIEMKGGSL